MAIKVNTRYGQILMNIGTIHQLEHSTLEFEPYFVDVLENRSYDLFIDIGAGWGYFSVIASNNSKRVLSFEPHPARFALLEKNIKKLNLKNLETYNMAVGTGKEEVYINKRKRGMVGPKSKGRVSPAPVKWISLQNITQECLSNTVIIKIDVEGNEMDVIESAGNLKDYKNYTWLIERHKKDDYGYNEEDLFTIMKPFTGKLLGTRRWTTHYIFEWKGE